MSHTRVPLKKCGDSAEEFKIRKINEHSQLNKERRQKRAWAKRLKTSHDDEEMQEISSLKQQIDTNQLNIQFLIQQLDVRIL